MCDHITFDDPRFLKNINILKNIRRNASSSSDELKDENNRLKNENIKLKEIMEDIKNDKEVLATELKNMIEKYKKQNKR